jgi:hypothetical protein
MNAFATEINPSNGLPMISDSGIDVEGNAYGTDSNAFDDGFACIDDNSIFDCEIGSDFMDDFSSGFDDSFSSDDDSFM